MNKEKASIKKNYIYSLIYQLSLVIIPLITTPYISRVLNVDGIGIYSYTLSIVTYFSMFATLGVAVYGQLEIAACRDNKYQRSKTFWEIVIARSITSVIVIIVYFIYIIFNSKYKAMYLILLINIISTMIDISWYFQGIEKFKLTVTRNLIVKIVGTILIFGFVKKSTDLYKYALILQGTIALGNITLWQYIKKEVIKIPLKELKFYKHWKNSIIFFIPTVATSVYTVLDKSMIGWITGSEFQNGYYEQAHKIEQTLVTLITSLGVVTMPRVKYLLKNNNESQAHVIIDNAMEFIIFVSIPMMFGILIISDYLVPWFLGENYIECIPILKIFSVLMLIVGLDSTIGRQCLMAAGKQRQFNIGVICGAIINFILNMILIKKYNAIGAAIASVSAEFMILSIFMYYSKDLLNIKKMFKSILKYSIYSCIMSIIAIIITKIIGGTYLQKMLITMVSAVVVYVEILFITKDDMIKKSIDLIKSKLKINS